VKPFLSPLVPFLFSGDRLGQLGMAKRPRLGQSDPFDGYESRFILENKGPIAAAPGLNKGFLSRDSMIQKWHFKAGWPV
jgi:hypothetical protein